MNELTSREFFRSLLNLTHEWEVAGVTFEETGSEVKVDLAFSSAVPAVCPICRTGASLHDHGKKRQWRHLDTMGRKTFLCASVPRVNCPDHGPQILEVPWAARKTRFTFLYEEHVLKILESSKSVASACGLLKSGWGACDRILKRVTELSQMQRASAARDADILRRRYRNLAALLDSIEETALDVARRIHRKSVGLSLHWEDEIHHASGGLLTIKLPENELSFEHPADVDMPGQPADMSVRDEGVPSVEEGPSSGTNFIVHLERLTTHLLAVMEAPSIPCGSDGSQATADSLYKADLPVEGADIGRAA